MSRNERRCWAAILGYHIMACFRLAIQCRGYGIFEVQSVAVSPWRRRHSHASIDARPACRLNQIWLELLYIPPMRCHALFGRVQCFEISLHCISAGSRVLQSAASQPFLTKFTLGQMLSGCSTSSVDVIPPAPCVIPHCNCRIYS